MLCPKLCTAIAAGAVEQDNDGLPGFKIPEGAGAFPNPTGIRVGLKDVGVDLFNKRTVRCLLTCCRFYTAAAAQAAASAEHSGMTETAAEALL